MAVNPSELVASLLGADPKHLDELKHHGVKGMKWGIRRSPAQLARSRGGKKDEFDPVRIRSKPGERVTAVGGSKYKPSEDAKVTAARKQIARDSTTDSLTTKQLQSVVQRMELEQKYNKLNPPKVGAGKAFVKMVLENDKNKLATTGDYKQTSTYKLGKTVVDITTIATKAAKKK